MVDSFVIVILITSMFCLEKAKRSSKTWNYKSNFSKQMPFFFKISDSYEPSSLKAAIAIASFAPITFQTTTITQKMYVITKHVKRVWKWTKSIMSLTKCKISRGGNFRQILWMQIFWTSTIRFGSYCKSIYYDSITITKSKYIIFRLINSLELYFDIPRILS